MTNNSRLTCLILAMVVEGCAGKQPPREKPADVVTSPGDSTLRESIAAQTGSAPCSSSSVCRTIAFGAKACGGPRQYLIYSTSATDSARLDREVARYNEAERKRNRKEGRMSDCMAVMKPQVSCVAGQCRAATAGVQ
jgi:hypothetical protein